MRIYGSFVTHRSLLSEGRAFVRIWGCFLEIRPQSLVEIEGFFLLECRALLLGDRALFLTYRAL